MITTTETFIIESRLDKIVAGLHFCHFKSRETESDLAAYEMFLSTSFGLKIDFTDGDFIIVSHWEDDLGDPYRIRVWDDNTINLSEAFNFQELSATAPWSNYTGKPFTDYKLKTYSSSFKKDGDAEADIHQVSWGVVLGFDNLELLAAAISSENPFRKGTQDELLLSEDETFIEAQLERFEDFFGFYGAF